MKAYKVIFELLKHPFADVRLINSYVCNHIRYNSYCKEFSLESIDNKRNRTIDALEIVRKQKQQFNNGNVSDGMNSVHKTIGNADAECAYSGISHDVDDKLASEVFFKGVKVVPPEGFLIGNVTETESGISVEFVKEGMQ